METSGVLEKPVDFTKTITATKYDWVLTNVILHTSIELVIFLYADYVLVVDVIFYHGSATSFVVFILVRRTPLVNGFLGVRGV